MVARLDDVRRVVTSELKAEGDLLYVVGETFDELGGSQLYRLFGQLGANVPKVRKEAAVARYLRMAAATERGLIESCHDLSDGGLAVALAEAAFGGGIGFDVTLPHAGLSPMVQLYSESHSRFLVSIKPENREVFEAAFGDDATLLGEAYGDRARVAGFFDLPLEALHEAWRRGLEAFT
ncbi:MAG: AIR synthase-related protein [Myxococcales bacterium]